MNGMNSAGRSKTKTKTKVDGLETQKNVKRKKNRTLYSLAVLEKSNPDDEGMLLPISLFRTGTRTDKGTKKIPLLSSPSFRTVPLCCPYFFSLLSYPIFVFPQFELSLLFLLPILFVSQSSFCRCMLLFVSCIEGK